MDFLKIQLRNRFTLALLGILILAIFLRFLYFPNNVYFGYDQARDAFLSQEILKGHCKIVGPPTSTPGLNHGALFYYIFAPVYFAGQGNPEALAIFLRIYNAMGVVLIFFVGATIFNKRTGILSSLIFAFSYEQTQYALYMTHPALAVLTVLLFYLGLSLLFFRQKTYGLIIAAVGLSLSFQFHFLLFYLGFSTVLLFLLLRKKLPKIGLKTFIATISALVLSSIIYLTAEVKFGFKTVIKLYQSLSGIFGGAGGGSYGGFDGAFFAVRRYIQDNLFFDNTSSYLLTFIIGFIAILLIRKKDLRPKIIFLAVWFITGLFSYIVSRTSLYFYGVGTSLSLIILISFFITSLDKKFRIISAGLIAVILISNIYMISQNNPNGPNKEINVQTGMLLTDEKKILDYIYSKAANDDFAVTAFTMPLYINTTWSYLFEWYGGKKYGRLPIWGGNAANGYPGNLRVNSARSTLPYKRFLIIEPARGVERMVKDFLIDDGWFTDVIEEKKFGKFTVLFQKPK